MPADVGNQEVTIKFYDAVDSFESNERFRDIRPTGIYKGGYLTKTNDTTITVSPAVAEIRSKITSPYYQVKVETTTTVTGITVGSGTPYVVLRWSYTEVAADDFMEVLGVASPDTFDIVVGKCNYSGATLTGFDYAERTNPHMMDLFLKIEPEETPSMYVRIRGGRIQLNDQTVQITDQLSGAFSAPGGGDTVGAVYVDSDGAIQVSSDFTQTGELVLAEIALTNGQTEITVDEISDVRSFLTPAIIPDDTTIRFNSSTGKLEQVPHTHAQLHDQAHGHDQLHDSTHIHGDLHSQSHTHALTARYLHAYNDQIQCVEQSTWTKLTFAVTSKNSGITFSSSQITLSAGKAYNISYVAQFESTNSKSPRARSRLKVVSGDTSWDLEENTFVLQEAGLGIYEGEDVANSWSGWIIPNQATVIRLEAITRDPEDMDNWGECRYAHINVFQSEVGGVA
jgi:hypothetical protein